MHNKINKDLFLPVKLEEKLFSFSLGEIETVEDEVFVTEARAALAQSIGASVSRGTFGRIERLSLVKTKAEVDFLYQIFSTSEVVDRVLICPLSEPLWEEAKNSGPAQVISVVVLRLPPFCNLFGILDLRMTL